MKYAYYATMAWIRGLLIRWPRTGRRGIPTVTTGLNGRGEAKTMLKHGWVPYVYQRTPSGGHSRTFKVGGEQ